MKKGITCVCAVCGAGGSLSAALLPASLHMFAVGLCRTGWGLVQPTMLRRAAHHLPVGAVEQVSGMRWGAGKASEPVRRTQVCGSLVRLSLVSGAYNSLRGSSAQDVGQDSLCVEVSWV